MDDIRKAVMEALREVAVARQLSLPELQPQLHLAADLGLKSLDLAHLVALLEMQLGFDPFAKHVAITSVRTIDDLCAAYNSTREPGDAVILPFEKSQERGLARRQVPRRERNIEAQGL